MARFDFIFRVVRKFNYVDIVLLKGDFDPIWVFDFQMAARVGETKLSTPEGVGCHLGGPETKIF